MERERRSKMTQMFTQLQTSVPGLLPQVHQSSSNIPCLVNFMVFGGFGKMGFLHYVCTFGIFDVREFCE